MLLHWEMAYAMLCAKQYREAIEYARRALEIDANFYLIWGAIGLAQLGAGLPQEAITSLKRSLDLAPWWYPGAWYLSVAYFHAGDRERSQEWARKLAGSHGHSFGAALYYAAVGEVDTMFKVLDMTYRQRDLLLLLDIANLSFFDPYRADPRFHALLQRMNLA
jgi:tetratricopeptide (TPR) repeat protein